ncbi:TBC1 domain family member 12-like [Anthonomus grandis grandis]|uniref:TBC1 domain family member 12-like n=1 Tax=Anthonomus grandis grandis TaxID=2921223 RepID=UPI0021651DB0|nr:TBC1 domain family member 12-like [Anthonomus grandis grandis]
MTDSPLSTGLDTSGQQLIEKWAHPQKSKCKNLLKNGFKLNLIRNGGYKSVLSKSSEDLSSHKLLEQGEPVQKSYKECSSPKTPKGSPLGSPTSETWFNTWPERYDKLKSVDSSPERTKLPVADNQNTQTETSSIESNVANKQFTLNEALKNISLAYSPVTKKLHLVENIKVTDKNIEEESHLSHDNNLKHKLSNGDAFKDNIDPSKKYGHRRIQDGSFSSTISTLSEPSTSGSLIGSEDRSLSNFEEDNDCPQEKTRKKSLTQFFSKNVFSWKSNGTEVGSSVWKFFGKSSVPCNNSPVHSVASSSALIQLKRPSSLPAKTFEEEQKHAQEYNEILAAAKRKEAKSSAAKEKQKKMQLQMEEQQANSAKHFSQQVIPNWIQMEKNKKTQELWWQGLPSSVRGKVWRLAIGNDLNITPQLYEICLTRAQNRLNSPEPPPCEYEIDQESSMDGIELDISRTFPNLCIFQQGGPYSDVLHSLLAAYVCFRPDVGYVQGMSYIAAILILNMEPLDAFVCFANLLNQPLHLAAFTLNQTQMNAYYNAYNRVFNSNLPKLYGHFQRAGLTPDLYLHDWIYTLYAKAVPLDVACRIWDIYLRDGFEFVFRTAIGILHLYQPILLTMDFLHGAQFLTKLPEDISSEQLFKSIQYVTTNVGKTTFSEIVEKCGAQQSMTDLYR